MDLPALILDISVAAACTVAAFFLVKERKTDPPALLAILLAGFAVVSFAVSVDLIWHIGGLVLGSLAVLTILVEGLLLLSPSNDLPKLYVRSVQIGFALLAVGMSRLAVWHYGHNYYEQRPFDIFDVACLAAMATLAVAYGRLRPRGRPWTGIW